MLTYSRGAAPDAIPSAVREINGRKLAKRCKSLSPAHRALLAVALETGDVRLARLTRAQARLLTGASRGYVVTVRRLTPAERRQVELGLVSLVSLHNRPPTDADIDRFIRKAGANRVLAAIDRFTSPEPPLQVTS
jgi:hypothetical protein